MSDAAQVAERLWPFLTEAAEERTTRTEAEALAFLIEEGEDGSLLREAVDLINDWCKSKGHPPLGSLVQFGK